MIDPNESGLTFEQAMAPVSTDDGYSTLKDIYTDILPEITDYSANSFSDAFLRTGAQVASDNRNNTISLRLSSFAQFAQGNALDLVSAGFYDTSRVLGTPTVGQVVLTLTDLTQGPYTRDVGEEQFKDKTSNATYHNTDGFLLDSANPWVVVSIESDAAGTAGNNPLTNFTGDTSKSNISFVQTMAGVVIDNPPVAGTQTWITVFGTDAEPDQKLQAQITNQWATLGVGGQNNKQQTIAQCLSASANVAYVSIDDNNPSGPGTVNVWCASLSGSLLEGDIALVQSGALDNRFEGCNSALGAPRVKAMAAGTYEFQDLSGSVYITKDWSIVSGAMNTALANAVSEMPIGGEHVVGLGNQGSIFLSDIEAALDTLIVNDLGIKKYVLTFPGPESSRPGIKSIEANIKPVVPQAGWNIQPITYKRF